MKEVGFVYQEEKLLVLSEFSIQRIKQWKSSTQEEVWSAKWDGSL